MAKALSLLLEKPVLAIANWLIADLFVNTVRWDWRDRYKDQQEPTRNPAFAGSVLQRRNCVSFSRKARGVYTKPTQCRVRCTPKPSHGNDLAVTPTYKDRSEILPGTRSSQIIRRFGNASFDHGYSTPLHQHRRIIRRSFAQFSALYVGCTTLKHEHTQRQSGLEDYLCRLSNNPRTSSPRL